MNFDEIVHYISREYCPYLNGLLKRIEHTLRGLSIFVLSHDEINENMALELNQFLSKYKPNQLDSLQIQTVTDDLILDAMMGQAESLTTLTITTHQTTQEAFLLIEKCVNLVD